MRLKPDRILLMLSIACCALLLLVSGALLAQFNLPPKPQIAQAVDFVWDWKKSWRAYLGIKPVGHLMPARVKQSEPVVVDIARSTPGVTFVVGLFGKKLGARLFNRDGSLLYEWPIDFFSTIKDQMAFPFDGLIHGSWLYPNGDLIVNMDGRGMVRIDVCGKLLWQNFDRTHHSLFADDAGYIWSPMNTPEKYQVPQIAGSPFRFDRVGKFDPKTGKRIATIDLVEILVKSGLEGIALANQPILGDMMHLNDVEILTADKAAAFPDFEAGDIMLNSRHFNQIWVLDGKTHEIKWLRVGLTQGAHDPDFQPDGTITVLDNRPGGPALAENGYLGQKGGSRIISLKPGNPGYTTRFVSNDRSKFYTAYRGKHQVLSNGNILITESDGGRVIEVTPDGTIVWSFVNHWSEDEVAWVMGATRYPEEFREIGNARCGGKKAPDAG